MPFDPARHTGRLRRLAPEFYRGRSFVHWSMTMQGRAVGWLDELHHARVREYLLHALGRYRLLCPAYCLMSDHAHLLLTGWDETSDQRLAVKLLRQTWNEELRRKQCVLQKQSHDHVLRQRECGRDAFMAIATYVLENPVRAGLVDDWRGYSYSGAVVPGYPSLDPRRSEFWEVFWRIDASLVTPGSGERLTPSATLNP